jgi:hypothetical protein
MSFDTLTINALYCRRAIPSYPPLEGGYQQQQKYRVPWSRKRTPPSPPPSPPQTPIGVAALGSALGRHYHIPQPHDGWMYQATHPKKVHHSTAEKHCTVATSHPPN